MVSLVRKFRDDESGIISVELVLVVPILVWVFLSTFVYFDVFRVETNATRATITMAEMFSREDVVDNTYIDNAREVLRELTYEEANPDVRITVYTYRASDETFRRVWSRQRGYGSTLNNADLAALKAADRLPPMDEFDHAIFIETRTQYDAPFSIGLGPFVVTDLEDLTFETDMVINPRGPRLCFERNDGTSIC